MLKKLTLAAFAASALTIGVPQQATAAMDDYEQCMLRNGCFWASGDGSNPGHWVCPNPPIYMDCVGL